MRELEYWEYVLECLDFNTKPLDYDTWRKSDEVEKD